jgi:hypothetical protein
MFAILTSAGRAGDLMMEPAQVDTFVRAWIATLSHWEDGFLQHQAGTIDPASMASAAANHRVFLSYPGCRTAWKTARGQFTGAFRDYIEGVVRDTRPVQPPDVSTNWKAFVADEQAEL